MITTSRSDVSSAVTPAVIPKLPVTLDTKGRVRTSKEQRRVILAEFACSGLSAAVFARQTGLKYSTFALWVQRYWYAIDVGAHVGTVLTTWTFKRRIAHAR